MIMTTRTNVEMVIVDFAICPLPTDSTMAAYWSCSTCPQYWHHQLSVLHCVISCTYSYPLLRLAYFD